MCVLCIRLRLPRPHLSWVSSEGFLLIVNGGLGLSEDLRVWLGSLPAAPLHPRTAQLCQLNLGSGSHCGSMVSLGLDAEQREERNIPEKTRELPSAWCDQAPLPQRPNAEQSLWQPEGLRTVDPGWWDELGLAARAAVPWQHLLAFGHLTLFTGGAQPSV